MLVQRTISWGQQTIPYQVRFLASRTTLSIEVHPDSSVWVRAPAGCSESVIRERMQRRAAWISRQLAEFEQYKPRMPARQYVSGETHLYLGRQYRLKVVRADAQEVKLQRGQIVVSCTAPSDPDVIKRLLQAWYLQRARQTYDEVLQVALDRFKSVQPPRVIVRVMRSRWGSLSEAGTMTLNSRLIQAPRACIEYVIVHELCHVGHRDHDARFFKRLAQVMPDWQKRKLRLEQALL